VTLPAGFALVARDPRCGMPAHEAGSPMWNGRLGIRSAGVLDICDDVALVPNSDDLFERAVLGLVSRISGRKVAALALLFYPGIGLILPLVLHWSLIGLAVANAFGVVYAAVVSMGWLFVQLKARDRRHLIEWTTNLRLLSAEEFEWLVGEVFRREGWKVQETGSQSGADGNVDLHLSRANERRIVQCKRWISWLVGVDEVRGFAGTLLREGLPGTAGIFVTLSDFTPQARSEAKTMGITLVDNRDLHGRVEKARRIEPCPDCEAPMVFDRSARGWWLRCVAPGCPGKHDLGGDPGRAVDFLTRVP
jgi:Restriction endonuclease